uniref:U28-Austrotoxin-Ht1f_1 n=1 Tax=Hickmania troglodytes TaxID=489260 RepID=A0A482Z932_9ARAC
MQWVAVAFLLVCLTLAVAEENLDMETAPQQREDCKKGEVKWNGHCEVGVDKCCGRCVRCKCRGGNTNCSCSKTLPWGACDIAICNRLLKL